MSKELNLVALTVNELVEELAPELEDSQTKLLYDPAIMSNVAISNQKNSLDRFLHKVECFSPKKSNMNTIALDSTCITTLRSRDNLVFAARASAVMKNLDGSKSYRRWGPIFLSRRQQSFGLEAFKKNSGLDAQPSWLEEILQGRIRLALELSLLRKAFVYSDSDLILFDGCPPSSIGLKQLAGKSINAKNQPVAIIGISKTTSIDSFLVACEELERAPSVPAYVEIGTSKEVVSDYPGWHTFVVKFSNLGAPLRIDILPISIADPLEALAILAGSDGFASGYHESLRLAHHLSIFTQTEVTGMKILIESKTGEKDMIPHSRRLSFLGSMRQK